MSAVPVNRNSGPAAEGATSAERAVHAARRFAGTTLNVGWETGDQAQDPLRFSGPLWERLTGVRINVVELGIPVDWVSVVENGELLGWVDGSMLDGQLNTLVTAMATFQTANPGFDPTAGGNTQAPADATLQAALAAAWHH